MRPYLEQSVNIAAGAIIIIAVFLSVTSSWNDSPIVDEIPHIGSGFSYIDRGDFRLNPEHPPLAKDLAGLAAKITGASGETAYADRHWTEDINGQWGFGRQFIFNSGNDATALVRSARLPQLIFFILLAIVVFVWTKKLYGPPAAVIALFLFSFSPTVLAHSRFVTTDIPALFGIVFAAYFFIRFLKNQSAKNLWLAGLVFGIAQLTKFSVFLLVPFFLVIALLYVFLKIGFKRLDTYYALRNTIFVFAIGFLFIVWPVYYFHTWNYPPELQKFHTEDILETHGNRFLAETVVFMSDKPVIRGLAQYGLGLLMVTQRQSGGNTTFFMGEVRNWAWPEYFPVVYFLKEPLAFWGLIILALSYPAVKIRLRTARSILRATAHWSRNHFTELTMLLWIALYWYTSIRANLNIGVRHLLPIYGFTYILLAGQITKIAGSFSKKKLAACCLSLVALSGWYLIENLRAWPHYLSYFNQTALIQPAWIKEKKAGYIPGGHNYAVDSNLDWGQDLKRLADWVKRNGVRNISLDYFGWADQSYYLGNNFNWIWAGRYKNAGEFLAEFPQGGHIAVSASFYMGSREKPETSYAWLDDYKPLAVIGNSIFIWYISPAN